MVQLGELMMILELHRQGLSITAIARRTGRDPKTVRKYIERGIKAPVYGPRSGAPRTIADARIEAVIVRTLESLPPDATHWSSRGMSRACGLSVVLAQIWSDRRCWLFGFAQLSPVVMPP